MPWANVLLIEDSAPDELLLKIALDEAGLNYSLTCLRDGAEATQFIRERAQRTDCVQPDIILLDINLPRVNGLEILKEIRAGFGFTNIPVLVLSSSPSPRHQNSVSEFPFATFEAKPADLDGFLELGRTIKRSIEGQPKERQAATPGE